MRNQRIFFVLIGLLLVGLVSCTVQKAPGAYAPAKNKVDKQKLQQVAADTVDVVPQADPVVRIMGGSEGVDSLVMGNVAVEPSPEVVADPVMVTEVEEKEVTVVDTVVPKDTTIRSKDSVSTEVVVQPVVKPAEKEVTRSESFRLVAGQGNVELKNYHVVIGSFSVRENAMNLQSQMRPDYEPILVINERGMYRVLLVTCETYQEAKAKIEEIKDQFPDAWCLVQKK